MDRNILQKYFKFRCEQRLYDGSFSNREALDKATNVRVLKKFLQSLIVVTVKFKELWLTRKKLNWKSLPTT